MVLCAAIAPAHANDIFSPSDPFRTQKKIAPYGTNLKPAQCPPLPDAASTLTLNEVVLATICHNPDAKAAYFSLLANADSYDGTLMSYLPDITASATGARSWQRAASVPSTTNSTGISASTSVTLYDFGRRETSLDIAERTLVAAGLTYDSTLQGFIASSLQAYFKLLSSQFSITASQESLKLAQASLEAAELKYKLGTVPLSDVLQARASVSQAELATQQADNALTLDSASLAQSMGMSPLIPVKVTNLSNENLLAAPLQGALPALIEKAKEKRTDLRTKKLQLENAEDSFKNTRKRGLPTVSLSAGRSYADWDVRTRGTHTDTAGVSLSIPIFTGFGKVFSERAERHQLEAQKLGVIQSERDVEKDVLQSWQNYHTARKSFATASDSLKSAEQLKDIALGRYRAGVGSILELINAQVAYRSSLQSHLSARYSLLTTRVDLIRSVGELDLNNMQPPAEDLPALAAVVELQNPTPSGKQSHETR